MRRWDSFVEKFIHSLETRNLSEGFIDLNFRELQRFGGWLKRRKPRPELSEVEYSHITEYLSARSRFKSKSTTCSVLTALRGMGNFLVDERSGSLTPCDGLKAQRLKLVPGFPGEFQENI